MLQQQIIRPSPLPDGAHIRIVSPSNATLAFFPRRAERARRALSRLGFRVSYAEGALRIGDDGTTAGTARERAADLLEALIAPDVDAVLAADGGRASADIVAHLDAEQVRRSAKPFIGYCDNVFINFELYRRAGLVSYYGCAFLTQFGEVGVPFPETLNAFRHAVSGTTPLVLQPFASRSGECHSWLLDDAYTAPRPRMVPGGWRWIVTGTGAGRLLGGEISYLVRMAALDPGAFEDAILFWDIAPGDDGDVAQLVRQLTRVVDLGRLRGMLVGPHVRHEPDDWAELVHAALLHCTPQIRYPVVVNADVGHMDPAWVLPYGDVVTLDSDDGLICDRGPDRLATGA